jgi:acetylornithine deacetylase
MIDARRLRRLLRRMIDIYSPSGKETDLLEYLRDYLKERGADPLVQPVDENRYNLLVLPEQPGPDIGLALIGHLDTIAAYDLEDYGYESRGDLVKGLGSADMKSGCAAMIEAYLGCRASSAQPVPAALCLVVGEEENGDGAERLISQYHFPWALVGEPTDLLPCLSSYGYLEIQIESSARRKHASVAAPRENAIETLLQMMLRLSQYLRDTHPELVYNFRDLYSNPSGFASPDRCEAWIDIHAPPEARLGEIVTAVEEESLKPDTGKGCSENGCSRKFHIQTIDAGYALPEKGALVRALKSVYGANDIGWRAEAFRSHSDANQLWAAGIKPIVLGPGRLEDAHASDESVSFDQVLQAARLYFETLRTFF